MNRMRGRFFFDSIGARHIDGVAMNVLGNQYYVSKNNGNDANVGTNPEKPVKTIQAAIDLSNDTIDWAKWPKKRNVIYVEPQSYAENLTPPYDCDIIGLGIRGTGENAEVRPAQGSAFTGTFLGLRLIGLRFEHLEASVPVFDIDIANDSQILSCDFALGADVDGVACIDTENSSMLVVEDCDCLSLMGTHTFDYFGYHRGGGDKYLAAAIYPPNRIVTETCGIYVATNCTASGSIVEENFIIMAGRLQSVLTATAAGPIPEANWSPFATG